MSSRHADIGTSPILLSTLEQPVYLPGDELRGVWASSLLGTVSGPEPNRERAAAHSREGRLSRRGDLELAIVAAGELRRAVADRQVSDGIRGRQAVSDDDQRPATPPIAIDGVSPRPSH